MIPVAGSVRSLRPPLATGALIAACVLVFLHETRLPSRLLDHFIQVYGLVPARQAAALAEAPLALGYWLVPMFTSMFLHGGWAHLIGNMMFLWIFGDGVENRMGHARFLAFYLACGLAAGQAQVVAAPDSVIPMVGASGAVAGVLGAYLVLYPTASVVVMVPIFFYPYFFQVPALFFLGFWFLQQLIHGTAFALNPAAGQAGGVAWWAHVGGFVAGVVLLPLFLDGAHLGHHPPSYRGRRRLMRRY